MSNEIIIARPDTSDIRVEVLTAIKQADAVQITTADEHSGALELIKALRDREKRITEHFEPSRKALDVAKKEVLAARDTLVKPLAAAREVLSGKAVMYQQEQEWIAEEARRKAEEEARVAREKAEAEAQEREKERLAALEQAIEEGDEEKAEEILDDEPEDVPEIAPVEVEAPKVAKVQGAGTRTTWSAEVVDKAALIQYVAANPDWSFLLDPSMPGLNRIAVAEKENMSIPGVKAISSTTIVTR